VAGEPQDPDHIENQRVMRCLTHTSGTLKAEYPYAAMKREIQGRLFVDLQFDAPDQPPVAKVYSARNSGPLHDEVESWTKGLRLPCQSGRPARAAFTYVFIIDGTAHYGFKDNTLGGFLGAVKDIDKRRVDFDFRTMGCPFEVRLHYLQPHHPNFIEQLDSYDATRQPFLDWLKTLELKVPGKSLDSIYADEVTLPVPCATLPAESTGVILITIKPAKYSPRNRSRCRLVGLHLARPDHLFRFNPGSPT
jgi:hypothetical protein